MTAPRSDGPGRNAGPAATPTDHAAPDAPAPTPGAAHAAATATPTPAPTPDAGTQPHLAPVAADPREPALALRGLTKVYGSQVAVDTLTLDIPRGSFYGLVGPNGAGKTTAIMMATGLLRPDAGAAFVCGHDVWGTGIPAPPAPPAGSPGTAPGPMPVAPTPTPTAPTADMLAAKNAYGLLADGLPVFDRLSGHEYLEYLGRLRGMSPAVIEERSADLLTALGLDDAGTKSIVDYSAGMTKKILLAGALLHRPEILILDEPLEAVDPVSGQVIREILRRYVAAGGTVVMSSHVMELVEGLCDHVAVVAQGRVLTSGTIDEVRAGRSLSDVFVRLVGGGTIAEGSLGWLGGPAGGTTPTAAGAHPGGGGTVDGAPDTTTPGAPQ
ncbi:ABC transporter ATP-binding protein [Corynebacterium bovis]|uniref:ABC transporter ATP-binding protein n=1 Tax=Corynebacterium bovis TaxID=36808 RepID=UPI003D7062D1